MKRLLFLALAAFALQAQAQLSCTPSAPRTDPGTGFVPFGAAEQLVARGGNAGPAWEWAIGTDTEGSQSAKGSLDWVSGKLYAWTLIYSGTGSATIEVRDAGTLVLSRTWAAGMDTGNAFQVQVSTNPSIGPGTTMAATVSAINGHALSGAVSQTGNNTQAEQNLYYFFPPMASGFTATGTVSLTYGSLPAGARVQFLARAGTIACSGGNAAPTVSITSPAANATFTAPASITLTANAQDTDGTVTQVQYFANASPIGTATASPYSFTWTNVPAGAYSLTAVATDNAGATTTSAPVPITVGAAQAKLYFIHTDHLNTPRLIADDQQRTVWRWDNTDPFGGNPPDENPSGLGTFEFPLRLPGQYYDRETNLHYNMARNYWPDAGRYVEADPLGVLTTGRPTPTTTLNQPYSYAGSEPLRAIDPTGLVKWSGWGRSFIYGAYTRDEYELESECKCGSKVKVKVVVDGFGKGFGRASYRASADFEDQFECPNPMAFAGPAFGFTFVAGVGFGAAYSRVQLGVVKSSGWTAAEAVGFAIGPGGGRAEVTDIRSEDCKCQPKSNR
jgi:RHS repeat-associated protein